MNLHGSDEPAASARAAAYRDVIDARKEELRAQLERIFIHTHRFVWEVGCGHGHFLTAYAQANPQTLCIGVDLVSDRIDRAERKRERAQLTNLHFLRADARLFLATLPPHAVFSDLYILFPDPWPKARHHKHRILQPAFLTAAAVHAGPDARLCFRTDFPPYFEDASATLASHPAWRLTEESWPFESDTVFQSRAEQYQSLIARRRPSAP